MPNPENLNPPWKAGDPSPNPKGHTKGQRNRSTIARQWLEVSQKIKNPITGLEEQLEQQDIIMLGLIKQARNGNVQAARELMDSAYGKITDKLEQSGGITIKYEEPTDYSYPAQDQSSDGIPESI
jgi:hypothetical protein